jgi:hypothetical protein
MQSHLLDRSAFPVSNIRRKEKYVNLPKNHPLNDLQLYHLVNWAAWKKAWNEATLFEIRYALLGMGLELANYETFGEAVMFYLALADGYRAVHVRESSCGGSEDTRTGIGRLDVKDAPAFLAYKAKQELDRFVFNAPWKGNDHRLRAQLEHPCPNRHVESTTLFQQQMGFLSDFDAATTDDREIPLVGRV